MAPNRPVNNIRLGLTDLDVALHFKLGVANENSPNAFEDAEFQYKPQLDPHRDKALIDLLPDFLIEEITFPRPLASKFYARVMKVLTE